MQRSLAVRPAVALAVVIAAGLALPATTLAQEARGYAGAGFFLGPWSPEDVSGSPSLSFTNTGGDDTAMAGGTVEAGVTIGRRFGLGLEVGLPARRTVRQEHFYFNPFRKESQYRDTTMFAVLRLVAGAGAVKAELVGGGGIVHQNSVERTAFGRFGVTGYTFEAFGPETTVTRWGFGATGGVDLPVRLSPGVALVPQGRVVYVDRGDIAELPGFSAFGLPTVTWRAGLVARARF